MDDNDAGKSIWKQPLGDVMKKDITIPEFMKKEITIPDVLKKDINDLPIGEFLRKERHLRRQVDVLDEDDVEMVKCSNCGRETPATVSNCLHCESPLEEGYRPKKVTITEEPEIDEEPPASLIDSFDDSIL